MNQYTLKLLNILEQRDFFVKIGAAIFMYTNNIIDGFLADKLNERYPRLFQDIDKNCFTINNGGELMKALKENPSIEEAWLSIIREIPDWNQPKCQFTTDTIINFESLINVHENRLAYLKEKNKVSNETLFRAGYTIL